MLRGAELVDEFQMLVRCNTSKYPEPGPLAPRTHAPPVL